MSEYMIMQYAYVIHKFAYVSNSKLMFFDTVRFHQVWSEFNFDDNHFTIDNHVERYTDIKWPFDFFWKVTVKCNLVETKSNILYRYVDKYLNNFDLSSPDMDQKIETYIYMF